jgi:hypothetical protein
LSKPIYSGLGYLDNHTPSKVFIDTNKNKWIEKQTKTNFLAYCFMVKTNISKYKGAAIYLSGMFLDTI